VDIIDVILKTCCINKQTPWYHFR